LNPRFRHRFARYKYNHGGFSGGFDRFNEIQLSTDKAQIADIDMFSRGRVCARGPVRHLRIVAKMNV
jgi:hypothetical protein